MTGKFAAKLYWTQWKFPVLCYSDSYLLYIDITTRYTSTVTSDIGHCPAACELLLLSIRRDYGGVVKDTNTSASISTDFQLRDRPVCCTRKWSPHILFIVFPAVSKSSKSKYIHVAAQHTRIRPTDCCKTVQAKLLGGYSLPRYLLMA